MAKYFVHLKLPFDADMEEYSRFAVDPKVLGHSEKDASQVDHRVLEVLDSVGVGVSHAEAFYTPPQNGLNIHIDSSREGDLAKLNFCYGAHGSLMNWWELKDPSFKPIVRQTGIGTNYLYFPRELCRIVSSTRIGRPTIVNAGRPHSVINPTREGRWVTSLVLCDSMTRENLTIYEAQERLVAYASV